MPGEACSADVQCGVNNGHDPLMACNATTHVCDCPASKEQRCLLCAACVRAQQRGQGWGALLGRAAAAASAGWWVAEGGVVAGRGGGPRRPSQAACVCLCPRAGTTCCPMLLVCQTSEETC